MKNDGKVSKAERQVESSNEGRVGRAPLVGVAAGMSILVAGLVCLYLMMRTVGLENGGSCVSGGPYEIAPGHECGSGLFELGFGGALGLIIGFLTFLWSSDRYGGPLVATSAGGFGWSAFWGGLGGSFLSIGNELPDSSDVGSEFKAVGVGFLVLAALGLAVALGPIPYSMQKGPIDPRPTWNAWAAWLAAVAAGAVIGIVAVEFVRVIFE